jgi:hypothetical protein
MTPAAFRKLALALDGAVEGAHMGHPDFRVHGRVFASLSPEGKGFGGAMLSKEAQEGFLKSAPKTFEPFTGAWGRMGATKIHLADADAAAVAAALQLAHAHIAAKAAPKKTSKTSKASKAGVAASKATKKTPAPRAKRRST